MNFAELEELHSASQSDNEKIRTAALQAVESTIDAWTAEYLSLPENCHETTATVGLSKFVAGDPRWTSLPDLASWVVAWLTQNPGESNEEMRQRRDRMRADKLGIIVRAHKLAEARARRTCDCDYSTIFGDRFDLSVHWCCTALPHSPKEITV